MNPFTRTIFQYPYFGFDVQNEEEPVPELYHTRCEVTHQDICYCNAHDADVKCITSLKALHYDFEAAYKKRKFEKERMQAIRSISNPVNMPIQPIKDIKICSYCENFYIKDKSRSSHINLCGNCYDSSETSNRKLLTFNARKKRNGQLLPIGTTISDLGRRGRPRIKDYEETEDIIQCHFPKCLRRNIYIQEDPELLKCSTCQRTYHAKCSDPPLNVEMVRRFNWTCLECKRCAVCMTLREESHVIVCDACDRVFHTKCFKVPNTAVWLCFDCGYCKKCLKFLGNPTEVENKYWESKSRICEKCAKVKLEVKEGEVCKICCNEKSASIDGRSVECKYCGGLYHLSCLKIPNEEYIDLQEYVCSRCQIQI